MRRGELASNDREELLDDGSLGLHVCLTTLRRDEVGELQLPSSVALGGIGVAAEVVAQEDVIEIGLRAGSDDVEMVVGQVGRNIEGLPAGDPRSPR